jgi:hypothetical protein
MSKIFLILLFIDQHHGSISLINNHACVFWIIARVRLPVLKKNQLQQPSRSNDYDPGWRKVKTETDCFLTVVGIFFDRINFLVHSLKLFLGIIKLAFTALMELLILQIDTNFLPHHGIFIGIANPNQSL